MKRAHVYPKGCVFSSLDDIRGKHVTVMGLGLNGGGEASVKFFAKHGAFVTVTDTKSAELLAPTIQRLEADTFLDHSRIRYVLGSHQEEDFSCADCVIKNPAVRYEGNPFLEKARAIETDVSIFLHFTRAPIIAVTGSKGKSSTVSAIHFGLTGAGFTSFLGGNITVSPLTFLEHTNERTPVVLELSSWQLRDLRGRGVLKPHIALVTTIVPDHQNFYGNMDNYIEDKCLIFADQDQNDYTILDGDPDGYLEESEAPVGGCSSWGDFFAKKTHGTVLRYSRQGAVQHNAGAFLKTVSGTRCGFVNLGEKTEQVTGTLLVPGEHNRINVLNAALVMRLMGVSAQKTNEILASWRGIPHRLEQCHTAHDSAGHTIAVFYNDTCSTVPEATVAACRAFETPVILIAGGTDKNLRFEPLASFLQDKTEPCVPKALYLLSGTGTEKLLQLLQESAVPFKGPYTSLRDLLVAVKQQLVPAPEPQPVVFSPGATSFGLFANEFDRGDTFKALVKEIFSC